MSKFGICIFIFFFLYACHSSDSSFLRIKIDGGEAELTPVLRIGDNTYPFLIDSAGFAEI